MLVAIPLFPKVTALDAIGPYDVLQRVPDFEVIFLGHERGTVRTDNGMLGLVCDAAFEEVPNPDVVVVPGGVGTYETQADERYLTWLRNAHTTSRMTTSVCTGALLLGAAGLLDGLTATTYWAVLDDLKQWGAEPTQERVVEHLERRIITAAGVASGIDMALRLVEVLTDTTAAKAAQLLIEYDPKPPFHAGSPTTAGEDVIARAWEYLAVRT